MTIRVAVGCAANEDDAESQQVLEYTLRKHASQPVDITWMKLSRDPKSRWYSDGKKGWQTQLWSTPFSGFRWAVPGLFGFEGRAIYMDSDCIIQADIAELWDQEFKPGRVVMAKGGAESWRYCVSLWDCAAVKNYIVPFEKLRSDPNAHRSMINFFKSRTDLIQSFKGNWNCIDGEDYEDLSDPEIKIIHYSDESCQPHAKYALARMREKKRQHWFDGQRKPHWRKDLQELFDRLLFEASVSGYPIERYTGKEIFGPYKIANHQHYKSHKWAK